jgi:hypothetical protein
MATAVRANNLSTVTRIGAGIRLTDTAVPAIIAALPEGFDPKARGAIANAVHAWACGDSERPAVKVGPKGDQRATDYGRGVDTLVTAVKRAMMADTPKPVRLAVTHSGDGVDGGSVVIPTDHALYPVLVAMIAAQSEEAAA